MIRIAPLLLLLTGCGSTSEPPSPTEQTAESAAVPQLPDVTVDELATLPTEERIVIDVRTPSEFEAGHVPGAVNIPLDQLPARLSELEPHRDAEIHAICEVGGRSARAADLLSEQGFRVHNVSGGTAAWRRASHPIE